MYTLSLLLLLFFNLNLANADDLLFPNYFSTTIHKRTLQSCEESHGTGFQQCGPAESGYCYNPTQGQKCCADTDYSFCSNGSWCAPVAGYCCLESESLQDCATAAGFDIPASASASASDTDSSDGGFSASTFGRHHKNKNGTTTVRPSGTGATGITRPTGTGSVGRGGNSTVVPPVVSFAGAENGGVVLSLAVAVVMAVFLV